MKQMRSDPAGAGQWSTKICDMPSRTHINGFDRAGEDSLEPSVISKPPPNVVEHDVRWPLLAVVNRPCVPMPIDEAPAYELEGWCKVSLRVQAAKAKAIMEEGDDGVLVAIEPLAASRRAIVGDGEWFIHDCVGVTMHESIGELTILTAPADERFVEQ